MTETLEGRIVRLERSVRLHRATVALVGLLAVTCGSGVTANYGLVRTARLQIVDGNDKPQMTVSAKGGGTITFSHAGGSVTLDAATVHKLVNEQAESKSSKTP